MLGYWLIGISVSAVAIVILAPTILALNDERRLVKALRRALLTIREEPLGATSASKPADDSNHRDSVTWSYSTFNFSYSFGWDQDGDAWNDRLTLGFPTRLDRYVVNIQRGWVVSWQTGTKSHYSCSGLTRVLAMKLAAQAKEALARQFDQLVVRYSGGA